MRSGARIRPAWGWFTRRHLKGLGVSVLQVVSRHDGDTYRAVYTVRFRQAIHVLHAFQNKVKRGIATPKKEIELIRRRLKVVERHYTSNYREVQNNAVK